VPVIGPVPPENRAKMRIPPGTSSARGTYLKWLRRIVASVAVLLIIVLALGAAVLNNNASIERLYRRPHHLF